jgi:hypothetical protein
MNPHSQLRRIGWIIALGTCAALYLMLHLKVHAVLSDVVRAERQLVALEQENLLLETEFETRSNQLQLAKWNRVDFGYTAPTAAQFIEHERQLASFGGPPMPGSPAPIRVAGASGAEQQAFPRLVSPLTGKPVDTALIEPEAERGQTLASVSLDEGSRRIQLTAVIASASE